MRGIRYTDELPRQPDLTWLHSKPERLTFSTRLACNDSNYTVSTMKN